MSDLFVPRASPWFHWYRPLVDGCVFPPPLDDPDDVVAPEAELSQVLDPLGLEGLGVGVGGGLQTAANHVTSDNEAVPRASWSGVNTKIITVARTLAIIAD